MTNRHHAIVTRGMLLDSLRGCVCPACGQHKPGGKSLCAACYRTLSTDVARALYKRFGEGYEAAMRAAWAELNPEQFFHPAVTPCA